MAHFSIYVHKGGLKPHLFHLYLSRGVRHESSALRESSIGWRRCFKAYSI